MFAIASIQDPEESVCIRHARSHVSKHMPVLENVIEICWNCLGIISTQVLRGHAVDDDEEQVFPGIATCAKCR